ncbi:glycoside hydrolase family 16 protein [Coniophora puteana RWD-64-598 SS2]|uniref:Glycoside hydrolase family 16 protein n=1 Tax=Coniophora puteana (strain RWD-64-598) TaxID=741705 RepID=A0A5M3MMY2_CONPW|nr:glycoside hydrolase family 16 protein [Coniophora puteana RWD-64-598 SS2]EIW80134.1 glycoside hydrolase family 16 protein [Coniophora puteana RWD-64-598 SS2]
MFAPLFLVALNALHVAAYSRTAALYGQNFLNAFTFQSIADPTNGRGNYVDLGQAWNDGLITVNGGSLTLRADSWTKLGASGPGRNTFRLMSNTQYNNHVAVFDIGHMPTGCGTWPAVWEVGQDWPNNGEIDIVEGVNSQEPNQSTLHTSNGCTMPASRKMSGYATGGLDCSVYDTDNTGCGTKYTKANSFGPDFNNAGGGWYAIVKTSTAISMYFWGRNDGSVPNEVRNPGQTVNPASWGTPSAYYPSTQCNFNTHIGSQNIIINLAFCGDWAGAASVYGASGCPSTCTDYVNSNPSAFSEAYFEFNALNIYE